jgi:hypothetical protein
VEDRFALALALLVLAVFGGVWFFVPARRAARAPRFKGSVPFGDTLRFRRCTSDDECVAVRNGCCDCTSESSTIAVRRDMEAAFKRSFICGACMERVSRPCWEGTVHCESNQCEFVWAQIDPR